MTSSPPAEALGAAPVRRFDWRNLRLRALSAAILIPATLGVVWYGHWLYLALIAVAVALLTLEWGGMSAKRASKRAAVTLLIAILLPMFAVYGGHPWWTWILVITGAAVAAAYAWARRLSERPADAAYGVLYLAPPAIALVWLRLGDDGRGWVLMLLLVSWAADSAAFVTGSVLKGPKLWPRLSPNKTWSGFFGGLVGAAAMAAGLTALARSDLGGVGALMRTGAPSVAWAALIGLLVGVATMAGDLWESMLKRRFGVKDSGDLIPGHGGLLDRVDGLMFAAVAMAAARLFLQARGPA